MIIHLKNEVKSMLRLNFINAITSSCQYGILGSTFIIILQKEMKDNLWVISLYSMIFPLALLLQKSIAKKYNRILSKSLQFNYITFLIVTILQMITWIIVIFDSSYIIIIGVLEFVFTIIISGFVLVNQKIDRFVFNSNKHLSNFKINYDLERGRIGIITSLVSGLINVIVMKTFAFDIAVKIIVSIFIIIITLDMMLLKRNYENDKMLVDKYF